ncbi:sodium-dependent transporter [Pseudoflavonifractor sp. BIOML-A6]|nr:MULTISPECIES: sodium-dependent transporter [unclassified Pseudoflavonifractor]MTQ96167.1 sodium-dependent transporter [Pseudoflavonifractor sp. BIOML-A16]MTR06307.1 sodium-dependent transporter [Pseudoflavonifractor sp. BIOML-A15]MTR33164.1 sodium-dependent transporter [Pseudoflavonifractor sp. BIOML-A14]MTR73467.1 sodium-dependent transporter [Pseudoflavonifractor sp. BIOML-A18]MTS63857.1 sodium-dependent transporter [Pseudoflavonifractor sp. BIOML-A5]MTS91250.1 sodium-dependent transport
MAQDHSCPARSGKFNSSIGFILAAVGSAVGMGNIWLFPYRMTQCGGGAFLIPYFIFVALFSYCGLSGEFALGRLTGTGTMGSFDYALKSRGKRGGKLIGVMPLLGVLGIAIGYSVVVGWGLRYTAGAISGSILAGNAQSFFDGLAVSFGSIPWHLIAIGLTVVILVFGISAGIEKISKFMMPAFFILFLIIAVRVAFLPGASEGYKFLLLPDFSKLLEPMTWVYAMGQAFFSLSINGAGMLIYGSYMKKSEDIIHHSVITALLDSLAALLASFAIIPAVFAFGISLDRGPSLMFVTLPQVFQQMPGGRIFAILFFVSVFFAGITSLMNMLEACSAALEKNARFPRWTSIIIVGAAVFGVSVFLESLAGMGSWMDLITIYVAPFGAVLAAVFIYWVLGLDPIRKELMLGRDKPIGRAFDFLSKYIYVPISAIVVILGIAYGGIG